MLLTAETFAKKKKKQEFGREFPFQNTGIFKKLLINKFKYLKAIVLRTIKIFYFCILYSRKNKSQNVRIAKDYQRNTGILKNVKKFRNENAHYDSIQ